MNITKICFFLQKMPRNDEDLNCRVINYIISGNYKMIQGLFKLGFLRADDTFDNTGRGYRGNPEDLATLMTHVAQEPLPNYRAMIDVLLENGCINDCIDIAIEYKNYQTAAYLIYKGGSVLEIPDEVKEEILRLQAISN